MTNTLSVRDNRTGKELELDIEEGTVRASAFRQLKVDNDDFGMMLYDPAFKNTASCRSAVTVIDGDAGILRHRGYPIEELAEQSNYLEVAQLLLEGELPNADAQAAWSQRVKASGTVHETLRRFVEAFDRDAHAMGRMVALLGAASTLEPGAKAVRDPEVRERHITRIIGQMPTLGAWCYRHSQGLPLVDPDPSLSYAGNFLRMLFSRPNVPYEPNPVLERALDVLFILHADHEQNCSANAARAVGSAESDPYCTLAAATAALYGPLHGGANEAVLRMLREIGDVSAIPDYVASCKRGERRLMGFGHRVYKNFDPRAKIIKGLAHQVFDVLGRNPLLEIALELEKIALNDEYFVKRKLYPNVDFYSGLIYQSMNFPVEMFPVLFAIPRASGWLAQWKEMLEDGEQKIARPRQIYTGYAKRAYVPVAARS